MKIAIIVVSEALDYTDEIRDKFFDCVKDCVADIEESSGIEKTEDMADTILIAEIERNRITLRKQGEKNDRKNNRSI